MSRNVTRFTNCGPLLGSWGLTTVLGPIDDHIAPWCTSSSNFRLLFAWDAVFRDGVLLLGWQQLELLWWLDFFVAAEKEAAVLHKQQSGTWASQVKPLLPRARKGEQ